MKPRTVHVLSAVVFSAVALAQLARVVVGLPVSVGDWAVPQWVSVVAVLVAGGLAALNVAAARGW